jgi:hypothetical protein
VPIVANITEAYIILSGPEIVPEPATWTLLAVGTALAPRLLRRHAAGCAGGP